jgi:AcrR family transcriptional regulator
MERNQIIEKTTSLLKKYGLKSMTVDEISIRLSISKKTLYSHFNNKEELLVECLHFMHDTIMDSKLNSINPVIKLIKMYHYTVGYLLQFDSTFYFDLRKSPNLKITTQNYINAYKLNRIRPLIEEAKKCTLLVPYVNVDDAVDFYMKFIPLFFVNFKDDQVAIENHLALFLNKYFTVNYCK